MVPETVTQLLADWDAGDQEALQRLMPIVYDELHRLAKGYLQRQPLVAGSVTSRTTLSSALDRLNRLVERWIPVASVLHPYPMARFDAIHPRWKPYA
jgi:hypothetical protein